MKATLTSTQVGPTAPPEVSLQQKERPLWLGAKRLKCRNVETSSGESIALGFLLHPLMEPIHVSRSESRETTSGATCTWQSGHDQTRALGGS